MVREKTIGEELEEIKEILNRNMADQQRFQGEKKFIVKKPSVMKAKKGFVIVQIIKTITMLTLGFCQ